MANNECFTSVEVRLTSPLSQDQLLALARHGAQARISELQNEIAAIERAFPGLRSPRGGRARKQATAAQPAATANARAAGRPGHRSWSAAQRKEAAERMRAFWAKRKSARKK
jgi:hypothetical protein